ncbi:hypothetical protein niasHS_015863 [Heterodera schachtii]|uniref:Chitin-binding type-2 domain-containing protein n=1 Tax=Heterodera schachtii TaxID=97005 RepID=A0ABD2HVY8_HETSC
MFLPGKCYNEFGKCAYGKLFTCKCPDKLFYNEEKEQCDYKTEIIACGGKPTMPKFDCAGLDNGLYSIESCTSPNFYSCNGGHANPMQCPPGLLFDQTKKLCEFPDRCEKKAKTIPGEFHSTISSNTANPNL